MKICLSQITTLPKDTETDLETYSKAGFQAVELALSKLTQYVENDSVAELNSKLKQLGLSAVAAIGLASPNAQMLLTCGSEVGVYLDWLEKQIRVCSALGVETIGIGVDPKSKEYAGWESQAIKNIRRAGNLAQKYNMTIGIEFMHLDAPIGPFVVDNLRDTLRLVELAGHPCVGYNLDLFHHFRGGGSLDEIKNLDIAKLVNVHLCDLPDMPHNQMDDSHRLLPGDGVLPIESIVKILKDKGYSAYLSLELLNEDIWNDNAQSAVDRCMTSMRKFATM